MANDTELFSYPEAHLQQQVDQSCNFARQKAVPCMCGQARPKYMLAITIICAHLKMIIYI